MSKAPKFTEALQALFSDPGRSITPPAGTTHLGGAQMLRAPAAGTVNVINQQHMDHWGKFDVEGEKGFMQVFVFGGPNNGYLLVGCVHVRGGIGIEFDTGDFDPSRDMLIQMVTGDTAEIAAQRMMGIEPAVSLDILAKNITGPMIQLAQAFENHGFIHALDATAEIRGLKNLVFHVASDNANRYTQLVKGLDFKRTDVSDGAVFTRNVPGV